MDLYMSIYILSSFDHFFLHRVIYFIFLAFLPYNGPYQGIILYKTIRKHTTRHEQSNISNFEANVRHVKKASDYK